MYSASEGGLVRHGSGHGHNPGLLGHRYRTDRGVRAGTWEFRPGCSTRSVSRIMILQPGFWFAILMPLDRVRQDAPVGQCHSGAGSGSWIRLNARLESERPFAVYSAEDTCAQVFPCMQASHLEWHPRLRRCQAPILIPGRRSRTGPNEQRRGFPDPGTLCGQHLVTLAQPTHAKAEAFKRLKVEPSLKISVVLHPRRQLTTCTMMTNSQ